MDRQEIRERFRAENPEITDRVLSDSTLNSWLLQGNIEFSCDCRLITSADNEITAIVGTRSYNLQEEITNFFDIDENPGGGVVYNNKRVKFVSKAQLDNEKSYWRSYSNGTPKRYYMQNSTIYFDYPPDTAYTIKVDAILLPDNFDDEDKEPFNELIHLRPYHYSMVLYLQGKAKMAIGKITDTQKAFAEYNDFKQRTKKHVKGQTIGTLNFNKPSAISSGYSSRLSSRR